MICYPLDFWWHDCNWLELITDLILCVLFSFDDSGCTFSVLQNSELIPPVEWYNNVSKVTELVMQLLHNEQES